MIEELKNIEKFDGYDHSSLYNIEIDDYIAKDLNGLTGDERVLQHAINRTVARVHQSMEAFIHNMNTIHSRGGNCDSANADKVVNAAQEQLEAIRYIVKEYGIDALPEPLKDAALLRIANPEASLADLARLSYPPVTKSCISHRLKKIMSLASKE